MRQRLRFSLILLGFVLSVAQIAQATTYTSDPNLNHFTTGIQFATVTQAPFGDAGVSGASLPHTTTVANVNSGLRFYGNGSVTPVLVQFASPVSTIRVFPNIDHPGFSFDGYQYAISGSNDGVSYTSLFNALTVIGLGEPFTLGTFTGTAPWKVNNVLTTPLGIGPGGTVGYIADFSFSNAYKYYRFTDSGAAMGNIEPEFSGVGTPAPEPGTLILLASGLVGLAAGRPKKLFSKGE